MATILIEPRFNGFDDIALGGYVGGLLAHERTCAEVALRRPVRLATPYETSTTPDGTIQLADSHGVLASTRDVDLGLEAPDPVGPTQSRVASESYLGFSKHLIPTCFTCGPKRAEGDGLRIFPGPVADRDEVAAPWTPSASLADSSGVVRPEFVWSSLDCPTIWPLVYRSPPEDTKRVVTAKLAVKRIAPVLAGRLHVVVGWKVGESNRGPTTGGAIYSEHGDLLAVARHTLAFTDWGVPVGSKAWS